MAVVYRHIRLDKNEPFYIGIGTSEKRAYTKHNRRNSFWKNIIKKTDYRVEILFDDLTWEEACEKEIEFIKLYGRKDLGTGTLVNMTDGGDGIIGFIMNKDIIKKRSETHRGQKRNNETREKMSNSRKGIIFSETHKQNIREAHIKRNTKPPLQNKLTKDDVIAAREEYKKGNITYKELGIKYNVTRRGISSAIRGITWSWI